MLSKQKGDAKNDFLIFVGLIFLLFFIWLITGGPKNFNRSDGLISNQNFVPRVINDRQESAVSEYAPITEPIVIDNIVYRRSPWYSLVKIGRGNAQSAFQPREEYITLSASRRNPEAIAITGWILENGDGRKLINLGGNAVPAVSKRAVIPQGAKLFGGAGNETLNPIVIDPGGRAVVTTGSFPQLSDIPIRVSFQTNICTGYIEDLPNYNFTPSLKRACPNPKDELDEVLLENQCLNYIDRLSACQTPNTRPFLDRTRDGFTFVNESHLDRQSGFSRQCREFVLSHYNYRSCVANHLLDEDFYGNEWRIFLNQSFQLWGRDREVITLYDNEGRLVDQLRY